MNEMGMLSKVNSRARSHSEACRLRKAYAPLLKNTQRKTPLRASMLIGLHVGSALLVVAAYRLLWFYYGVYALPLYFVTIVFLGTRMRAIGNMIHECSHGSFVNKPGSNSIFGHFLCALVLTSFSRYKAEHASHHKHLGDLEKDRDFHPKKALSFDRPLTGLSIFEFLMRPLMLTHFPIYVHVTLLEKDDPLLANGARLFFCLSILFFMVSGNAVPIVLFWIVPYFLVYPTISYLTDCVDHAGLLEANGDELYKSRNFIIRSRLLRWFLFPRNDCYHLIHHLFPGIPIEHFDTLHEMLLADRCYRRIAHDLPGKLDALRVQSEGAFLDES